jgi:hypothetical protein
MLLSLYSYSYAFKVAMQPGHNVKQPHSV